MKQPFVKLVFDPREFGGHRAYVLHERPDGWFVLNGSGEWEKIADAGRGAFALPDAWALEVATMSTGMIDSIHPRFRGPEE